MTPSPQETCAPSLFLIGLKMHVEEVFSVPRLAFQAAEEKQNDHHQYDFLMLVYSFDLHTCALK